MKRIVILMLIIVLAIAMATMGISCKQAKAPAEEAVEEAPAEETETAPEEAEKVVVPLITHWWHEPGIADFHIAAKEAFEKENPNIEIEKIDLPWEELTDQIIMRLKTNTPTGIIFSWLGTFPSVAGTGELAPLDDYFANSSIKDNFLQSALDECMYNGDMVALPIQMSSAALIYNKKLLEEKGVEVPTTLDELYAAAEKLTDPSKHIYGFGALSREVGGFELYTKVFEFVVGNGGSFATEDGKPSLNAPETVEAVELWKKMIDNKVTPIGLDVTELRETVWNGQTAMIIDGPWLMNQINENNPDVYKNMDVALLPTNGHKGSPLVLTFYSIQNNFKYKDEAWKFLEFMNSPEWSKKWIEMTKSTNATDTAIPETTMEESPWLKVFQAQNASASPTIPKSLGRNAVEFQKKVEAYLVEIVSKDEPVKEALDKAQEELTQWLAEVE